MKKALIIDLIADTQSSWSAEGMNSGQLAVQELRERGLAEVCYPGFLRRPRTPFQQGVICCSTNLSLETLSITY